jgi:hypothetical protein
MPPPDNRPCCQLAGAVPEPGGMERKQGTGGVLLLPPIIYRTTSPRGGVKYFEAKIKKVEKFLKKYLQFVFLCGILCTVIIKTPAPHAHNKKRRL